MLKNFPVLRRLCFFLFLILPCFSWGQETSGGYEAWYLSNASGLALERIPSRLAALRNEFCLRVSRVSHDEIPERILSFYDPAFLIETRTLFEKGKEIRRQWIFRDEKGTARLNASGSNGFFSAEEKKYEPAVNPGETGEEVSDEINTDSANEISTDNVSETDTVSVNEASNVSTNETDTVSVSEANAVSTNETDAGGINEAGADTAADSESGFIEVFNADQYITEERIFAGDGSESLAKFFYNGNVLLRAESWKTESVSETKTGSETAPAEDAVQPMDEPVVLEAPAETAALEVPPNETGTASENIPQAAPNGAETAEENVTQTASIEEPKETPERETETEAPKTPQRIIENGLALQTVDHYHYTRSGSLRAVERLYHESVPAGGNRLRLAFPAIARGVSRAVEFEAPHMPYSFDNIDNLAVPAGTKAEYTVDQRGRALSETRTDEEGNVIAQVENTWSGERLVSVRLTAGEEERLIEFEYDPEGNRVMERSYRNGILERSVRSQGNRDMEELYMDGVVILRAYWEDGRKISEERVSPSGRRR